MKTRILCLFVLLSFLLSACTETLPESHIATKGAVTESITTETEPTTGFGTATEEPVLTEPQLADPPTVTTTPPATATHVHDMKQIYSRASSCTVQGEVLWQCACGENRREVLSLAAHTPTAATCLAGSVCTVCSATLSEPLGHRLEGRRCVLCDTWIESPLYVLGQPLNFDEKASSISEKLGAPTEIITEGDLVSLVYAADLARLTVIQTDGDGLWGMFTMDPEAKLFFREQPITIANFSGIRDPNSDAFYQDAGTCRIFGFRDGLNGGAYYGLWMRYSECRYDYIEDARLNGNFAGQNRLSYYYVNALRAKHGLPTLAWSPEASQVAQEYSAYMIQQGFFDHDRSYAERLTQKGISWRDAGENISQGYYNAFFVGDAYYNSASHRENLLSSKFFYVGTGFCRSADPATVFGAQIFFG